MPPRVIEFVKLTPNIFNPGPGGSGKTLHIVSLGDSYSAGNGARNISGKKDFYGPTGGPSSNCYRSHSNWEEIYRTSLIAKGYNALPLENFACSGSVTYHYANEEIKGPGQDRIIDYFTVPAGTPKPITSADCESIGQLG